MIRMGKRGGAETMGRVLMHEEGIERRAEGEGKRLGPLESGGQREIRRSTEVMKAVSGGLTGTMPTLFMRTCKTFHYFIFSFLHVCLLYVLDCTRILFYMLLRTSHGTSDSRRQK